MNAETFKSIIALFIETIFNFRLIQIDKALKHNPTPFRNKSKYNIKSLNGIENKKFKNFYKMLC